MLLESGSCQLPQAPPLTRATPCAAPAIINLSGPHTFQNEVRSAAKNCYVLMQLHNPNHCYTCECYGMPLRAKHVQAVTIVITNNPLHPCPFRLSDTEHAGIISGLRRVNIDCDFFCVSTVISVVLVRRRCDNGCGCRKCRNRSRACFHDDGTGTT